MSVSIKVSGDKLVVTSPYNPDFTKKAKRLNGKWSPGDRSWIFDPRDEERIRIICRSVYGTDGTLAGSADLVDVRVEFKEEVYGERDAIYLCGRTLIRAEDRDSGVKLGTNVVHLKGRAYSSGSRANWLTVADAGSVFEMRDVPRAAYQAELEKASEQLSIQIISRKTDQQLLIVEREKLVLRLAEIDLALAGQISEVA